MRGICYLHELFPLLSSNMNEHLHQNEDSFDVYDYKNGTYQVASAACIKFAWSQKSYQPVVIIQWKQQICFICDCYKKKLRLKYIHSKKCWWGIIKIWTQWANMNICSSIRHFNYTFQMNTKINYLNYSVDIIIFPERNELLYIFLKYKCTNGENNYFCHVIQ